MSHYSVLISSFLLKNATVVNAVNTLLFHQANCGILRNFRLDRTSRSSWWAALNSTIFPQWWQTALLWHGPAPSAHSVAAPLDVDGSSTTTESYSNLSTEAWKTWVKTEVQNTAPQPSLHLPSLNHPHSSATALFSFPLLFHCWHSCRNSRCPWQPLLSSSWAVAFLI